MWSKHRCLGGDYTEATGSVEHDGCLFAQRSADPQGAAMASQAVGDMEVPSDEQVRGENEHLEQLELMKAQL